MIEDPKKYLQDVVRPKLIALENTIIFGLLERAQYCVNGKIYLPKATKTVNGDSFLDYLLRETEIAHALAGRYQHPEEHSFSEGLPLPVVKRKREKSVVKQAGLNLNPKIKKVYIEFLRKICRGGDDKQYGSAAEIDVKTLQVLSRRIHIGMEVAEVKFRDESAEYTRLINARDNQRILDKLTDEKVEEAILRRVMRRAEDYQREEKKENPPVRRIVEPDLILGFYKDVVMPLTKEVEVDYFLRGLDAKQT